MFAKKGEKVRIVASNDCCHFGIFKNNPVFWLGEEVPSKDTELIRCPETSSFRSKEGIKYEVKNLRWMALDSTENVPQEREVTVP